ncbi:MAG: DUF805 domain-containing protein [Lentisphaeria bacterium]|nr:DUF805 domain-containing protein [Lentisphaeria bacterium]
MNWYIKCWKESFNFSGRARRKEYWMFVLFNTIVCILLSIPNIFGLGLGIGILYYIYSLAVLPASCAVSFRRLHDTNHSGWNFVVTAVLPYVLIIPFALLTAFGQVKLPEGAMSYLMAVCVIFGILCAVLTFRLIYLFGKPSDVGPNQYGEDPIGDPNRKPSSAGCFIAAFAGILILLILVGAILLPALNAAQKKSAGIACVQNLKNIGGCMIIYAADNDGYLPMDLNNEQFKQLLPKEFSSCPLGQSYQLLDSAKGLNLNEVESPSMIPVAVCDCHAGKLHVLRADGSVGAFQLDEIPHEILDKIGDIAQ